MGRIGLFLTYQRMSLRALFRRSRAALPLVDPDAEPIGPAHPSELCRCFSRPADAAYDILSDHDPGCKWAAAMCEGCAGTGWCIRCGGDGTKPDWDPDKTAPERPSARRIG